jgi:Activator of Hsp90 ATPase homolog 1-like protein
MTEAVIAQVEVGLQPAAAFEVFTEEIGLWWRRDAPHWNDRDRGLSVRIEPGQGGRFIEVYDLDTGEGFEVGRVVVWRPGEQLSFTWTQVGWDGNARTVVTVTFAPVESGTLVTLIHDGFDSVSPDGPRYRDGYAGGWPAVLGWYARHANQLRPRDEEKDHGNHH